MTQLQKVAIKRDPSYPAGQPAPMFLDCPCGLRHPVDFPYGADIHCECGLAFSALGWVLDSALVKHNPLTHDPDDALERVDEATTAWMDKWGPPGAMRP